MMANINKDKRETEENYDMEFILDEHAIVEIQHSLSELEILNAEQHQSTEKIAELFPADSPNFNDGFWESNQWDARDRGVFSISLDSSRRGSCSMPSTASEVSWSGAFPRVMKWPSSSSLDMALEKSQKNRERIDSVKKGYSKYATKMNKWCQRVGDRLKNVEVMLQDLLAGRQDPHSTTASDLHTSGDSAKQTTVTAFSWVVPYSELKRLEVMKVLSSQFDLRGANKLQAELHLKGLGPGEGSHLSITLMDVRESLGAVGSPLRCRVKVRVENQEDQSEAIEKVAMFDGGASIYKLIPISSVEDDTLNYLVKGLLTITILVDERLD
ncbi:uncharacterized protein [Diadema antillarum]|uniref:uncharacterized protein n=1 Tax=Diadema antillarum TaxID=105358 RepID=UPI003A88774F